MRAYLINILEKNVKLLPWHVLICVYVGIFCNLFCAKIIHMNFHLPANYCWLKSSSIDEA